MVSGMTPFVLLVLAAVPVPAPTCPGPILGYWQPVPTQGPPRPPGTGTRFECGKVVETESPGYGWQETSEPAEYEVGDGFVVVRYSGTAVQLSKGDMPPPGEAPRKVVLKPGAREVRYRILPMCPSTPPSVEAPLVLKDTAAGSNRCIEAS